MYTWILVFFTVFLKNRNISSKIKRSKVTDYAALTKVKLLAMLMFGLPEAIDMYVSLRQSRVVSPNGTHYRQEFSQPVMTQVLITHAWLTK